jgi:hypothetical protein
VTQVVSPAAHQLERLKVLREKTAQLAALRARRAAIRAKRYRADPVAWVAECVTMREVAEFGGQGWTGVWSKQREILDALQAGRAGDKTRRRVAVKSCHGVGKSYVAAIVAAWWLAVHEPGEAFVVTSAPTYAQVRAILWRYIRQIHKKAGLPGRVNQTEWSIDGEMVGFGRKPADHDEAAFQGIHAPHVLVILDEACGIPAQLWIAADALTTNVGCCILAIGNPDNPASYFKEVCDPLSQIGGLWHHIRISAFDSPNLTGEFVPPKVAAMLVSADWVAEKLIEWGNDNPIYISKVLGDFPSQNPMAIVRYEDVMACRVSEPRTAEEKTPVALGVDVGGGGDLTVIRERRGMVAGREWESNSDRPEDLAPLVIDAINLTGARVVNVDSIGIGYGLCGELRNRGRLGEHKAVIVEVNVAEKANNPVIYANKRAEIWWTIGRELSKDGAWDLGARVDDTMTGAYLVSDRTLAELVEVRWKQDAAGRILVEKKDEVRERTGGRSPDHADALLLAFYSSGAGVDLDGWMTRYAKAQAGAGGLVATTHGRG